MASYFTRQESKPAEHSDDAELVQSIQNIEKRLQQLENLPMRIETMMCKLENVTAKLEHLYTMLVEADERKRNMIIRKREPMPFLREGSGLSGILNT